jgi:2-keto-3-deoxy-L-rhamnonate aldolase RhmA
VETPFNTRLRSSERLFGVTLTIPDPFIAELVARQGFDFLLIDSEHSPISPAQIQTQLIALAGGTAAGLVRVASVDPTAIMQALDLGADGVVVPHVESADDARRAVGATRYPPEGERGVGPASPTCAVPTRSAISAS